MSNAVAKLLNVGWAGLIVVCATAPVWLTLLVAGGSAVLLWNTFWRMF